MRASIELAQKRINKRPCLADVWDFKSPCQICGNAPVSAASLKDKSMKKVRIIPPRLLRLDLHWLETSTMDRARSTQLHRLHRLSPFGILQVCQKISNDPICGGQLRTGPGKLGSMLQLYMWNLGNRTICGKMRQRMWLHRPYDPEKRVSKIKCYNNL